MRKWQIVAGGLVAVGWALLSAQQARGDTVLFEEYLDDGGCDAPECSQVSGGQFVANGWSVTSAASQILFDLGQTLPCGKVEVEFFNFDPINSGHTGEYVNFIGIYEGNHGNTWTAAGNDESQLQVQGTCDRCIGVPLPNAWRDERLKFKGLACSWDYSECGPANRYLPANGLYDIDWATTMAVHYVATVSWDCSGPTYILNDGTHNWTASSAWAWHPAHPDTEPHFRYVFVGRDNSGAAGTYIDNAVFVWVRVTEPDTCNCSQCQCTPGQIEPDGSCGNCGHQERTCQADCTWGAWICVGEGPCTPDQTQDQECGDCGNQGRTCDSSCQWESWSACEGPDPGGGNQSCDTGLPGICAEGIQRCVDGDLECEQVNSADNEVCGDGLDNDCNGVVDDPPACQGDADGGLTDDGGGAGIDVKGGCGCRQAWRSRKGGAATEGLVLLILLAGLGIARLRRRRRPE